MSHGVGTTAGLTRIKSPWVLGRVDWQPALVRQAVIWLARTLDKPILKLTDPDYNEHSLQVPTALLYQFQWASGVTRS